MFLLEQWASSGVMGLCYHEEQWSSAQGRAALTRCPWVCPCWLSVAVSAASMLCPEHPVFALGSDTEMQHFELQLWVTLSTGAEGTRAAHWQS